MERPALRRAVAAMLVVLLCCVALQCTDAARGNSLQEHVLKDVQAAALAAEAMLPAWQVVADDDGTSMDSMRRLLEEYALNAAEDDAGGPAPAEQAGDQITITGLLMKELSGQEAEDPADTFEVQAPAPERQAPAQVAAPPAQVQGDTPAAGNATAGLPDQEEVTSAFRRLLLQEDGQATAEVLPPAQDLAPAWQEVVETAEASRRLMQAAVNTTLLKEEAKAVLLASDAFGMVYTGGNFARAIFALLTPMVIAGQTGVVAVDANYLLNLSQLLAQFVAMLGDLLSKGARLTADGIAPI